MSSIIKLENIVKKFYVGEPNELEILHGISLEVEDGEFISIVGPSGSGKSTLMNTIGVLDRPTSGKYILDGIDVSEADDSELSEIRNQKIGFVFQTYNLISKTTAIKNIELPMLYAGMSRKERIERAHYLLDLIEMSDRAKHLSEELSGGQKQRVAIARAMANNPAIILADEPTGALDSKTGRLVMDLFHKLNKQEKKTVILITHSNELASETDRIVSIRDGRITSVKDNRENRDENIEKNRKQQEEMDRRNEELQKLEMEELKKQIKEESTQTEEKTPKEEIAPIEEIAPTEETGPIEEITPIEETEEVIADNKEIKITEEAQPEKEEVEAIIEEEKTVEEDTEKENETKEPINKEEILNELGQIKENAMKDLMKSIDEKIEFLEKELTNEYSKMSNSRDDVGNTLKDANQLTPEEKAEFEKRVEDIKKNIQALNDRIEKFKLGGGQDE